ncbi:MAG: hypothetical protein ACFCVG_03645 [Kineosporiaceae bacterium]
MSLSLTVLVVRCSRLARRPVALGVLLIGLPVGLLAIVSGLLCLTWPAASRR